MPFFLDIFSQQLNKRGEELCGDTVQVRQSDERSVVVLSDGLGSGVKANILSTLTARIIVEMLQAEAPLEEVVRTVIGTLPVCQVRQLAYATFTAATIDNATGAFSVMNFDNPRVLWLNRQEIKNPPRQFREIMGRQVAVLEGSIGEGDFLALMSDGVLHAGLGRTMNLGWGWENVAEYAQESVRHFGSSAKQVVGRVMRKVGDLYGGQIGDDASMVGVVARSRRDVVLFSGPPLNWEDDEKVVARFLSRPGRHVVCGGTTGNIVARYLDEEPAVVLESMRPGIPPIATMREVDLMTEGILTMNRAVEHLRKAAAGHPIPEGRSGDLLLAREFMSADYVHVLMGQRVNEVYQNPTLPANLSLRKNLVAELVGVLEKCGKKVAVESV